MEWLEVGSVVTVPSLLDRSRAKLPKQDVLCCQIRTQNDWMLYYKETKAFLFIFYLNFVGCYIILKVENISAVCLLLLHYIISNFLA